MLHLFRFQSVCILISGIIPEFIKSEVWQNDRRILIIKVRTRISSSAECHVQTWNRAGSTSSLHHLLNMPHTHIVASRPVSSNSGKFFTILAEYFLLYTSPKVSYFSLPCSSGLEGRGSWCWRVQRQSEHDYSGYCSTQSTGISVNV